MVMVGILKVAHTNITIWTLLLFYPVDLRVEVSWCLLELLSVRVWVLPDTARRSLHDWMRMWLLFTAAINL